MDQLAEWMARLCGGENGSAYDVLQGLEADSEAPRCLRLFGPLDEILDDQQTCVRARALILPAGNTRWDAGGRYASILDKYPAHIAEKRPVTAVSCVKVLPVRLPLEARS